MNDFTEQEIEDYMQFLSNVYPPVKINGLYMEAGDYLFDNDREEFYKGLKDFTESNNARD